MSGGAVKMLRCFTVALLAASVVQGVAPGRIPSALLLEAKRDPVTFLMLLSDAGVPCGLEVEARDALPNGRPDFNFSREPTVAAADVVAAFNADHMDYRATMMDDVLVIRPVRQNAAYLDSRPIPGHVRLTGMMRAAMTVFASLDPRFAGPGGVMGSLPVSASEAGEYVDVALDGAGKTVVALLNQIVMQSPRGWVVVTDKYGETTEITKFGFILRGGDAMYQHVSRKQ